MGIALDTGRLPIDAPLKDTATAFSSDPLTWVLTGGDDHSLVATFPMDVPLPPSFTRIGLVVEGGPTVTVDGEEFLGYGGWQHFGN